jgi:putative addiction module component (TIGR02574 family)
MSTKMERLALELLSLPASSRAELARRLIASLDEFESLDAEEPWLEEIKRRDAEIAEGKVQCIPAEDVFAELRKQFG